jgi:uncharacterized membrane protein YgdD (TMEM256/DUF423 family)
MEWMRLAALLAFFGVALGALGAHALKSQLAVNESIETWKTAALYHLFHSMAIYVVAAVNYRRSVCVCFALGIVLFSGSLYGLALSKWALLGPITPLGGVLFLVGWGLLAFQKKD